MTDSKSSHHARMRLRSGEVFSSDRLVAFLYVLMRNHLPTGVVEGIMLEHVEYDEGAGVYTNGWLAKYAEDMAERLAGKAASNRVEEGLRELAKKRRYAIANHPSVFTFAAQSDYHAKIDSHFVGAVLALVGEEDNSHG